MSPNLLGTRSLRIVLMVDIANPINLGVWNFAMNEMIPVLRSIADENPYVAIHLQVVRCSPGPTWQNLGLVADAAFQGLTAEPRSGMGQGLKSVASTLATECMPRVCLPPVIVLVSDLPRSDDFAEGLAEFMNHPWGRLSVRLGLAVGGNADLAALQEFIGHAEIQPFTPASSGDLLNYIRWVEEDVADETDCDQPEPEVW